LRKTEDIVDKEEGCQDLVRLCISRSRVVDDRAHPRPTGLTPPVALVATGAVVGATTAMTAPVATSATKRPLPSRPAARRHVLRTRRVRRVHVLTVLVALAALVARAPRRTAAFASTPHPPSPPPLGGEAKRTRVAAQAATPLLSARCPGSDSAHRHASKNFKNLLGFFNLVPVGSFCAALREKTSTWPKLM
jgi:hypothetical protein